MSFEKLIINKFTFHIPGEICFGWLWQKSWCSMRKRRKVFFFSLSHSSALHLARLDENDAAIEVRLHWTLFYRNFPNSKMHFDPVDSSWKYRQIVRGVLWISASCFSGNISSVNNFILLMWYSVLNQVILGKWRSMDFFCLWSKTSFFVEMKGTMRKIYHPTKLSKISFLDQ